MGLRFVTRRMLLLALLLPASLAVPAEPFSPSSDADIVERLPYRVDAAERARRAALARDPAQLPLATAAARAALDRARAQGDPRELGVAQAALAPWWSLAEAPAEVVLLRARLRQARHDFDGAQVELRRLTARADLAPVLRAQALLDTAAIHRLRAELPQARLLCQQLKPMAPLPAAACLAELDSLLAGQAPAAAQALARLNPGRTVLPWLALMRAELAERLGDPAALGLYRQALLGADEVYTRAALADWLLAQGRPAEVLALTQGSQADALQLRHVIALRRLGRDALGPTARLREALAAAERREPGRHAREQARFALDVDDRPREALRLAQANWAWQREPADAVLLLRAARAAGRAGEGARRELARFVRERGWQDARLNGLSDS